MYRGLYVCDGGTSPRSRPPRRLSSAVVGADGDGGTKSRRKGSHIVDKKALDRGESSESHPGHLRRGVFVNDASVARS